MDKHHTDNSEAINSGGGARKRRSRFSSLPPGLHQQPADITSPNFSGSQRISSIIDDNLNISGKNHSKNLMNATAKAAALQESISTRLAALRSKKLLDMTTDSTSLSSMAYTSSSNQNSKYSSSDSKSVFPSITSSKIEKRAKVYDLDMSTTSPLFKKQKLMNKSMKKVNPYLIHWEMENNINSFVERNSVQQKTKDNIVQTKEKSENVNMILLDERLAGGQVVKTRSRHKHLKFIEPGTFIDIANRKRKRALHAIKSHSIGAVSGGNFVTNKGESFRNDIKSGYGNEMRYYGCVQTTLEMSKQELFPRADTLDDIVGTSNIKSGRTSVIPQPLFMEWWDTELLSGKLRKEVVTREGRALTLSNRKRMNPKFCGRNTLRNVDDLFSNVSESSHNNRNLEKNISHESNDNVKEKMFIKNDMLTMQKLRNKCFITASVTNSKTYKFVQHPVPIKTPNVYYTGKEDKKNAPIIHLTKKEMKRQRKLRRAERQRELQDMQAAGLIPPPEPRLTLSNFMKVLGDQAIMDPSQMEAKVSEQILARKLKHERMNAERKLTKEQLAEKRSRKLTEDTSLSVSIALFLVGDMSHKYHRTKVVLNAQQNGITGCVIECESLKMSIVICEGGPKAIKRYTRLMTVRMKWKGENCISLDGEKENDMILSMNEEDGKNDSINSTQKFNPNNTCELVWTGLEPKRIFESFVLQSCSNPEMSRKVLEAKGVAHFWDQAMVFANKIR